MGGKIVFKLSLAKNSYISQPYSTNTFHVWSMSYSTHTHVRNKVCRTKHRERIYSGPTKHRERISKCLESIQCNKYKYKIPHNTTRQTTSDVTTHNITHPWHTKNPNAVWQHTKHTKHHFGLIFIFSNFGVLLKFGWKVPWKKHDVWKLRHVGHWSHSHFPAVFLV